MFFLHSERTALLLHNISLSMVSPNILALNVTIPLCPQLKTNFIARLLLHILAWSQTWSVWDKQKKCVSGGGKKEILKLQNDTVQS